MSEQPGTWCRKFLPFQLLSISIILLWLLPADCKATEQALVTAGPSWPGFTDRDGSGLYHDIIRLIFSPDYSIKHIYTSSDQANDLVALGRADIKLCEPEGELPLQLGKYPMYENVFYAVFRIKESEGWQGMASLRGRQVAWREGHYSQRDFPVEVIPRPVRSGESALMMLALGRVDFYVDDMALIEQSFTAAAGKLNREDFIYKEIGRRKYYPVFSDSSRGVMLKKTYEDGIEHLYRSGLLQPVYDRWDFPLPLLVIP